MNGRIAKKCRLAVYGTNASFRARKYYMDTVSSTIICDKNRHLYQVAKKNQMVLRQGGYDPDEKGKKLVREFRKRREVLRQRWEKRKEEQLTNMVN